MRGGRWILAFDGNQFYTNEAWNSIVEAANRHEKDGLKYFKVCYEASIFFYLLFTLIFIPPLRFQCIDCTVSNSQLGFMATQLSKS